mmetsp:Transcript_5303/g.13347  ORF Transcript_5303/g.13347 Transcript_5303/m.13347 type:complete len:205 (+) Transcript_5303:141-755(+)
MPTAFTSGRCFTNHAAPSVLNPTYSGANAVCPMRPRRVFSVRNNTLDTPVVGISSEESTSAVNASTPKASSSSAGPFITSSGISSMPVGSVVTKCLGASMCVPVCALKRSIDALTLSPFLCEVTIVRWSSPKPVSWSQTGSSALMVAVMSYRCCCGEVDAPQVPSPPSAAAVQATSDATSIMARRLKRVLLTRGEAGAGGAIPK